MVTQLIPRSMTQAELFQHGFIPQTDGTYLNPISRQQRVACRSCGKWARYTSQRRADVPDGYCRACIRAHVSASIHGANCL